MKPLSELLAMPRKKRAGSERAEVLRYFVDRARDKEGKPYKPSYIAMRLSHLALQDLYYLKSVLEDRERTFRPYEGKDGKMVLGFSWNKAFFGAIKVQDNKR